MPEYFIPDTIDLDSLVKDIPRPDVKRSVKFGCAYILDHFHNYPNTPKGRDIFEKTGGGVPIFMKMLRDKIGQRTADRAIKLLIENKVIKLVKNYSITLNNSRIYALDLPFSQWICLDFSRFKDIDNSNLESLGNQKVNSSSLIFLEKWLDPLTIQFDRPSLDYFVQYSYNRLFYEIENIKTSYSGEAKKKYKEKLRSLLNARFLELTSFFQDFMTLIAKSNRSESNGRFNTALTQMIKSGRYFLTCEGRELTEIDLNASQPFFFLFLLRAIEKEQNFQTLSNQLNDTNLIKKPNPLTLLTLTKLDHMMCTFSDLDFVRLSSEIARFSNLFQKNGQDFYSNLANELDEVSDPKLPHFSNRSRTKKAFMYLLFEQFEKDKKRMPVYQVFKKAFPMITEVLDRIKREKKNRLAIILQKLEAHFMLDVIAKKFTSKHPDAPIYTIHDAYLVKESDVKELDKLIKDELENQVGIRPSTKIKELSPTNLFMDMENTIDQEISLLKEKSRKKKAIESSDLRYFKLFENEIPKWDGEEVMTASVWAQVQNNPNYRPFLVDSKKMKALKKIKELKGQTVRSLFPEDSGYSEMNNKSPLQKTIKPWYILPPLFKVIDSEEEE